MPENDWLEGRRTRRVPRRPMSTNAPDDMNEATDDTDETTNGEQPRFAELNVGDDEFVIYDRENHKSWIQSTVTLDVGSMR